MAAPLPSEGTLRWGASAGPPSAFGAAQAAHLLPGKAFQPLSLHPDLAVGADGSARFFI